MVVSLTVLLMVGCTTFLTDPRPPLMDDNPFIDFVPTVVTNVMPTKNIN